MKKILTILFIPIANFIYAQAPFVETEPWEVCGEAYDVGGSGNPVEIACKPDDDAVCFVMHIPIGQYPPFLANPNLNVECDDPNNFVNIGFLHAETIEVLHPITQLVDKTYNNVNFSASLSELGYVIFTFHNIIKL